MDISNKNLFIYIVILICLSLYLLQYNIKLNFILGVAIICAIIYFNEQYESENKLSEKNKNNTKIKSIKPKSENITKHKDILDFVFSIQDLYSRNPSAYQEMIQNLDNFFDCYDEVISDNSTASGRFNDMKSLNLDILNSLQSIIYSTTYVDQEAIVDKVDGALEKLKDLLNYYLEDVYKIGNKYIAYNKSNWTMDAMSDSPYVEKNKYDTGTGKYSNIYSYDFY